MSDFEDDFVPDAEQDDAEEADDFRPEGGEGGYRRLELPETQAQGRRPGDASRQPQRGILDRIGQVFAPDAENRQPLRGRIEELFLPTTDAPETGIDRRGEAAARGAVQGASFGFSDELGGALRAAQQADVGAYRRERDAMRQARQEAEEQAPGQYIAGEVAGALPSLVVGGGAPQALRAGRAGRVAAEALALGGAEGLGRSEADSAGGVIVDTLGGAGTGLAAAGLGGAAARVPGAVREYLQRNARRLRRSADEARVLTAMGATGGTIARPRVLREAERVPGGVGEVARVMREQGLASRAGTTDDLAELATRRAEQSREAIGEIVQGVDDAGERVSTRDFANRMLTAAEMLADNPEMDQVAQALRGRALLYVNRFPDGMTMQQAQRVVSSLGDLVNWTAEATGQRIPNAQQAAAAATRALRESMDEAAERAYARTNAPLPQDLAENTAFQQVAGGPYRTPALTAGSGRSALDAYRRARRVNQVSRIIGEAAEESTQRGRKNRLFGLMDSQAANLAANMGGGPLAVGALTLGRRALAGRGAAMRATALETLAGIAERQPERLGRFAPMLQAAAQRGGAELAAVHYMLSQREPEYQQLVAEIED